MTWPSNYRHNMFCVGLFYHFTQIPWRAQNASKIYSHLRAATGTLACSSVAEGSSLCQGWCDFWTAESIQWVTECWWRTKERHKMYKHIFIWKSLRKRDQKNTRSRVPKPPPVWSRGSKGLDLGIGHVSNLHLHWGQRHSAGKTMWGGVGGWGVVRAQGWSSGERAVLQTMWRLAMHEGQHNGERGTSKRGVYLNR